VCVCALALARVRVRVKRRRRRIRKRTRASVRSISGGISLAVAHCEMAHVEAQLEDCSEMTQRTKAADELFSWTSSTDTLRLEMRRQKPRYLLKDSGGENVQAGEKSSTGFRLRSCTVKSEDDVIEPRNEILSLLTHAGGCAGQMLLDGSGAGSTREVAPGFTHCCERRHLILLSLNNPCTYVSTCRTYRSLRSQNELYVDGVFVLR
jgi:hypothetical protein